MYLIPGPSYYELLGLDASADDKTVQRNFRKLSPKKDLTLS